MKRILKKISQFITGDDQFAKVNPKKLTERELIRMESQIGSQLFGPIPKGHRREFFCLDEHTWIWHEEWTDAQTKKEYTITTRYEIRGDSIVKVQDTQPYQRVEGEEARNLIMAMRLYYEKVTRSIYHYDPHTGHPLPTHPAIVKK